LTTYVLPAKKHFLINSPKIQHDPRKREKRHLFDIREIKSPVNQLTYRATWCLGLDSLSLGYQLFIATACQIYVVETLAGTEACQLGVLVHAFLPVRANLIEFGKTINKYVLSILQFESN